jgi:hypothetical protein
MNKESLIWLVIRIAGLVFGYLAITWAIAFVSTYITISQTSAITDFQASELGDYKTPALTAVTDRAAALTSLILVGQVFYVVFHGVIAGYLLLGGTRVFDLLNYEGTSDGARVDVIDSLHLGDS